MPSSVSSTVGVYTVHVLYYLQILAVLCKHIYFLHFRFCTVCSVLIARTAALDVSTYVYLYGWCLWIWIRLDGSCTLLWVLQMHFCNCMIQMVFKGIAAWDFPGLQMIFMISENRACFVFTFSHIIC